MNVSEAARILGVTRATLYRLVTKHHININSALPDLIAMDNQSREHVAG
jgi:predicted DNA-binding protein (UPF0251 family)